MGFLVNDKKVKAAATSMHQFCQTVREIFPGDVDDRVVEAATMYVYVSLTRDLFGQRFAHKLQKRLRAFLKYTTAAEADGHIARITKHSEALENALAAHSTDRSVEEIVRAHVTSVIEAILSDAGFNGEDHEIAKKAYERFEMAIQQMRKHLIGIKDQNVFLLRTRNVA